MFYLDSTVWKWGRGMHTHTKVPGRNTAVTMASVNIDTLSRCVCSATSVARVLVFWAAR